MRSPHGRILTPHCLCIGAGGTQRLPRLVGAEKALDIMLSGRNLTASEALQLGIVDGVAESPLDQEEALVESALAFITSDRCNPDSYIYAYARPCLMSSHDII